MMDRLVTIKSCRHGMEVHLDPDIPFDILLEDLQRRFKNSARFFQKAQMAVTLLDRRLSYTEEQKILEVIADSTGIEIVCVIDEDPEHELTYKSIVERTLMNIHKKDGLFYRGTLSKRQIIESDTSIVILGDVEPEARVISKGSIVIIGALLGTACAGVRQDRRAYVAALSMQPKKLCIGNVEAKHSMFCQESVRNSGPKIAMVDGKNIYLDPLAE